MSCEVPEQWLVAGDVLDKRDDDDEPLDDGADNSPSPPEPHAERKSRRGRKPGPRTAGPASSHVEAERQRRDRLNRRFCELRAAVPTVSRMDRASLLSDATAYIAELRGRVKELETEAKTRRMTGAEASQSPQHFSLEVRMVGRDAASLRLTTPAARHAQAPACLMAAIRALDLLVQNACVCRVGGPTVQDVVVDVPAAGGLLGEDYLRAALLHRLLQESV
ncbi:hypothetical protein BAE44_0021046 [Dichanthelium oligosanthes]|uniref:Transcription factor n=1 Tax=Dichanthelium oligosanthes TaxID=888268 RepID=A0A1E5UYG1_9POAL|nr:hypothetical protein BAE44_0021046 [Dichanthelium oligosanthes]